jgi:glycerol-3-phosphate acyltransferase PlsY
MKMAAALVLAYLIGSVMFGLLVSRRRGTADIREHGSGKTGATNVLRTVGKKAAAVAAGLDLAKGALAVVLAGLIVGDDSVLIAGYDLDRVSIQVGAGLAAVAGHIWPVFYKFRGGRGVATFFGGLLVISPVAGMLGGEVLIIVVALTRFASLGSIVAVVVIYATLAALHITNGFPLEYIFYAMVGGITIIVGHRDNIGRWLQATERRLGEKS